jgi:hypothetical protein
MCQVQGIERPLAHHHVFNFHNVMPPLRQILAINEHSLLNPDCEESFALSKFYTKKISQITISKDCLLFRLEDLQCDCTPM